MSDRNKYREEQRTCKYHEANEVRLRANEARIKRLEKGLLWFGALLIANLGTAVTLLGMQLTKQEAVCNKITWFKSLIELFG